MGRITNVFQEKDGIVRTVELKTARNRLIPPAGRLCLLEKSIA